MYLFRIGLAVCCVLLGQSASAQVCGMIHEKPIVSVKTVPLSNLPGEPRFYYRANDFVVVINQAELVSYLSSTEESKTYGAKELAELVGSDIPLKRDLDLFAYNLKNWQLWYTIQSTVMGMITAGNVGIVNLGGIPVTSITLVREASASGVVRTAFAGKRGENKMLWISDCIAN